MHLYLYGGVNYGVLNMHVGVSATKHAPFEL